MVRGLARFISDDCCFFFGWRTVEMSRCGCDLGGREWRRFLGAWFCQRFSQENSSSTFVWCLSRMEVQQQNLFYLWRLQRRDVDRRESKILGSPFLVIP